MSTNFRAGRPRAGWPPNFTSTVTLALRPAAPHLAGGASSNAIRTGSRCTTFTQLPVAFWAGSGEKAWPAPGLKLATLPAKSEPAQASTWMCAGWPTCILASWSSLKLASTQGTPDDQPEQGLGRVHVAADLQLLDAGDHAVLCGDHRAVRQVQLGAVQRRLGLLHLRMTVGRHVVAPPRLCQRLGQGLLRRWRRSDGPTSALCWAVSNWSRDETPTCISDFCRAASRSEKAAVSRAIFSADCCCW